MAGLADEATPKQCPRALWAPEDSLAAVIGVASAADLMVAGAGVASVVAAAVVSEAVVVAVSAEETEVVTEVVTGVVIVVTVVTAALTATALLAMHHRALARAMVDEAVVASEAIETKVVGMTHVVPDAHLMTDPAVVSAIGTKENPGALGATWNRYDPENGKMVGIANVIGTMTGHAMMTGNVTTMAAITTMNPGRFAATSRIIGFGFIASSFEWWVHHLKPDLQ